MQHPAGRRGRRGQYSCGDDDRAIQTEAVSKRSPFLKRRIKTIDDFEFATIGMGRLGQPAPASYHARLHQSRFRAGGSRSRTDSPTSDVAGQNARLRSLRTGSRLGERIIPVISAAHAGSRPISHAYSTKSKNGISAANLPKRPSDSAPMRPPGHGCVNCGARSCVRIATNLAASWRSTIASSAAEPAELLAAVPTSRPSSSPSRRSPPSTTPRPVAINPAFRRRIPATGLEELHRTRNSSPRRRSGLLPVPIRRVHPPTGQPERVTRPARTSNSLAHVSSLLNDGSPAPAPRTKFVAPRLLPRPIHDPIQPPKLHPSRLVVLSATPASARENPHPPPARIR